MQARGLALGGEERSHALKDYSIHEGSIGKRQGDQLLEGDDPGERQRHGGAVDANAANQVANH